MGAWCGIGLLLHVLLSHHKPSLAYSLKNCTIEYFEDATADVRLYCPSRHLVEVPRDIPRRANFVNLVLNQIPRISRGDFSFMSELRTLWLDSNNISHVDDGSFVDLVALETLSMEDNKLTQLRANMFLGLSNLTMLCLGGNAINFIDSSAFHSLDRLQTLNLELSQFKKVTDLLPVFGIPNLRRLDMRINLFKDFQTKDLLLNVPSSVEELILFDNPLEKFSITTPVFPHLRLLELACSRQDEAFVWDIPDKTFLSNITNLALIPYNLCDISYNEIQKVLKSLDSLEYLKLEVLTENLINKGILETVCKIPTLRKLDLSFTSVDISGKLANCSQLHELDLSMIGMTDISEGSLQAMKRLRYLKASNNWLTEVPQDIRDLSSLEILDLSWNNIAALSCGDFANTTILKELYLSHNIVSKLDRCVFQTLKDLKILDLSNNIVWSFGDTFKMSLQKLEFLDLSENQMVILTKGDFKGLSSLKYLALTSKHINGLRGNVFEGLDNLGNLSISLPLRFNKNLMNLKRLQNLTVYYNTDIAVRSFHSANFKVLPSLKYLKYLTVICKGDPLGIPLYVPQEIFHSMGHLEDFTAVNIYVSAPPLDTFQFTPQLQRLTIGMTDMSDLVSELFYPIPNLQALDLSGSHLKYLDFLAQANLSLLRWLKLSDNELTVINQTVLESLPALRYLDLSGNPFTCGCDNARFIEWVKMNNQTQVAGAYQYTCSFPVTERGRNLLDFDVQSCWEDTGYYFFICNTCLVLLMLVASLTYHLLRWQFVYAFHLFLAFLYDGRRRKKAPHRYDAFVSYNVQDEAWVYQELLPRLEGEQGWRLCLHHRDFQPGKPIIENITDAIYGSRKTICVITQRYLQSEWCSREIQMASFRLFDEKKDVLILLFLEEIPARQLSPYYRMRKLVKRRTYLSWSQAGQHKGVFWQNVRRALETGEDAPAEGNDLLT